MHIYNINGGREIQIYYIMLACHVLNHVGVKSFFLMQTKAAL